MERNRREIELVGVAEAAELVGVSRQRIDQLARLSRSPGIRRPFPAPVASLACGKVWLRDDIEEWNEGRPRRRAPEAQPRPLTVEDMIAKLRQQAEQDDGDDD